jgi:hypothetical protein
MRYGERRMHRSKAQWEKMSRSVLSEMVLCLVVNQTEL